MTQAIFDLLDHLSRWLQEHRNLLRDSRRKTVPPLNERVDKAIIQMNEDIRVVDRVLSNIDVELTAHAALQSKAYARSLRNFEERIAHLKHVEKRTDDDLQAYYEHLHRIYADLDEPDGMEGVSISVIAPSLEHQIREHESVGRWTSAQSCWEVKLQQSPNDVQLHMGLMCCLRNLGHYGKRSRFAILLWVAYVFPLRYAAHAHSRCTKPVARLVQAACLVADRSSLDTQ